MPGLTIHCDGAVLSHLQDVPCFAAFVVVDNGVAIEEWVSRILAEDSTKAELRAILEALRWASRNGMRDVRVLTDSKAAFHAVRFTRRQKYFLTVKQIREHIKNLGAVLAWVPRKYNKKADMLCRQVIKKYKRDFKCLGGN